MEHILSLSYGKDSLACLGAIEKLGWPLDRIVHAEVWATDDIPADLPPMVEFKAKADAIIKERWGIEVEHICATTIYKNDPNCDTFEKGFYHKLPDGKFTGAVKGWPMQRRPWCNKLKVNPIGDSVKMTYERCFYAEHFYGKTLKTDSFRRYLDGIYGFPVRTGPWCNSRLKVSALTKAKTKDCVQYIGIAADEQNRFHNLTETKKSPLVEAGWTEADCRKWCEENDLLSPIYQNACRGGCWFCHNQGVDQLRQLRHNYPDLWTLLLKWDSDSPMTFHADGHTVHDFDKRFEMEDDEKVPSNRKFRWRMIK